MSRVDEAVREAHREVRRALGMEYESRRLKVLKFGLHRDGYFHAFVTIDGTGDYCYVHARWGSWFAPVPNDAYDSPSGREVVSPYKEVLAERVRQYLDRARRAMAEQEAKDGTQLKRHAAAGAEHA